VTGLIHCPLSAIIGTLVGSFLYFARRQVVKVRSVIFGLRAGIRD
jgi:hypothetical protein